MPPESIPGIPDHFWQTPAVRHLAWMCQAPSLVRAPEQLHLDAHLPPDIRKRLLALDNAPGPLLDHLAQDQRPRLGHYFEKLYHFLITHLMDWEVILANTPIREGGRTLGELDFVVRNPATGGVQHHEVAVKFYLGMPQPDNAVLWYGPNAQDRLDLKTERIRHHQVTLTTRPAARSTLADAGIHCHPDSGLESRLFMPGYLFYPAHMSVTAPTSAPPDHARGIWFRATQLSDDDLANWSLLNKPHWLGPYQHEQRPNTDETLAALHQVQQGGPPRLFAQMHERKDGLGWQEEARLFVVADHWPGKAETA